MSIVHYRLSVAFAASLSLVVAACEASRSVEQPGGQSNLQSGGSNAQRAAVAEPEDIDTEATIWTVLGLAKKESALQRQPGPKTGIKVSPALYQAALDTLDFVKFASEDPLTGSLVTEWYSPPGKPDERLKINVFILDRALRSDSIAVTVGRQKRSPTGEWVETTIARQVETDLENAILRRAGQLKRAWAAAQS